MESLLFRYELDGIEQTEKYPPSFRLTLDTTVSQKSSSAESDTVYKQLDATLKRPQCLFKDELEFQHTLEEYGKSIASFSPFVFVTSIHGT